MILLYIALPAWALYDAAHPDWLQRLAKLWWTVLTASCAFFGIVGVWRSSSKRLIPYPPALQRLMDNYPDWNRLNSAARFVLHWSFYAATFHLLGYRWPSHVMGRPMPLLDLLIGLFAAASISGLVAIAIPQLCVLLVARLWGRSEPPDHDLPVDGEIGIAPTYPSLRVQYLPGLAILLVVSAGALLSSPDPGTALQRASLGVAACAIFGYPLLMRFLS